MFKKVVQLRITEIILFKIFLITEVNYPTDMSVLKFYFASYEEFQEHFLAEAADHFYDGIYKILQKTVE
jgi:hypothetical protein